MSKSPTQRSWSHPGRLKDAKYSGDRKRRLKRTRTEPLPSTKTLLPSTNDGLLKELVIAKSRKSEPSPTAKALGWVAIGFAGLLLLLSYTAIFVELPEIATLVYYVVFVMMHFCVLSSQLMSEGKNGLGLLALAIYYPGLILWFMIVTYVSVA